MTASSDRDALLELAREVAPTYRPNRVDEDHPPTFAVLYPGGDQVTERMLDGRSFRRRTVHRLMCVGATEDGSRTLASAMVDAIDGTPHDDSPWLVLLVSDPLEDRTDPSDVAWTTTVEIHHHTRSDNAQP